MTSDMPPRRGAFPPRVGWIPMGIGLAAVTILAVWSVAPQFSEHVVGPAGQASAVAPNGNNSNTAPNGGIVNPTAGAATFNPNTHATAAPQQNATGAQCAAGQNGGTTAPGVTVVTTGEGAGFLGEAAYGMKAAINDANNGGGICGRKISLTTLNDAWNGPSGLSDIQGFISQNYFALVGEPDSEGLDAAVRSQTIDRAGIPVVGTDGMLKSQYNDPWVWPIAASTVSNMHIAAKYAVQQLHASRFGIVFDTSYKFGQEGAYAFDRP
jgi:hypothetical protein